MARAWAARRALLSSEIVVDWTIWNLGLSVQLRPRHHVRARIDVGLGPLLVSVDWNR